MTSWLIIYTASRNICGYYPHCCKSLHNHATLNVLNKQRDHTPLNPLAQQMSLNNAQKTTYMVIPQGVANCSMKIFGAVIK